MMFEEGSKCPVCEIGTLEKTKKDQRFTYQGFTLTFNDCQTIICRQCGEEFFPDGLDLVIDDTLTSHRRALERHLGITPP